MSTVALTLIGKPGCHLCDEARDVIRQVMAEFDVVELAELSILDHADLHKKYVDEIPVLLINGEVHNIWRVDPGRLREALREATQ